jgi:hypothetical protein
VAAARDKAAPFGISKNVSTKLKTIHQVEELFMRSNSEVPATHH